MGLPLCTATPVAFQGRVPVFFGPRRMVSFVQLLPESYLGLQELCPFLLKLILTTMKIDKCFSVWLGFKDANACLCFRDLQASRASPFCLVSAQYLHNKQGGCEPLTDAFVQMKAKLENLSLVVLSKSTI